MGKKIFTFIAVVVTILFGIGIVAFAINQKGPDLETANTNVLSAAKSYDETPAPTPRPAPILKIFTQPVSAKTKDGEFKVAIDGQKVETDMVIKTEKGGGAQIVYPNHSVTRIDENSEIKVAKLETEGAFTPSIELNNGKVWSRVSKLLGKDTYEAKTETTVASIRGTSFGLTLDKLNKQDLIFVSKSKVFGKCKNETQEGDVESGNKGVFNCKAKGKPKVTKFTTAEQNEKWFKFNKDKDDELDKQFGPAFGDNVLAATTTPTPSPTPSPTPTPTASATSTPTPTPTPTPNTDPTISSITMEEISGGQELKVTVTGTNYSPIAKFEIKDIVTGGITQGTLVTANDTQIVMNFPYLTCYQPGAENFEVRVFFPDPDKRQTARNAGNIFVYPQRRLCG